MPSDILEFYLNVNKKKGHHTRYGWLGPMPCSDINPRWYRMTEFVSEEEWYEWITNYILS